MDDVKKIKDDNLNEAENVRYKWNLKDSPRWKTNRSLPRTPSSSIQWNRHPLKETP